MSIKHVVWVVGSFPPPVQGQMIATERVANLLEPTTLDVRRFDLSPGEGRHVEARVQLRPGRVVHFLRQLRQLRRTIRTAPRAPVLWTAISPSLLGHLRDLLAVVPAFGPRQPVYGVVHLGSFDKLFRARLTAKSARWLVRHLRGVVFLTPSRASRCAEWIPAEKLFVIPNTVDEPLCFNSAQVRRKQRAFNQKDSLRLLFLSNMMAEKGYLDVLEAVRLLHDSGHAVRCTFAGGWESDADRVAFQQQVRACALEDHINHQGRVTDRAAVRELHRAADLFLLPSYLVEAQPLCLLEALSAGTPCIVAPSGGIPDIVRDGIEGVHVPPQDPSAIASAVERLMPGATWLAFSERARRRFVDDYSPDAVRRQWLHLLQAETAV